MTPGKELSRQWFDGEKSQPAIDLLEKRSKRGFLFAVEGETGQKKVQGRGGKYPHFCHAQGFYKIGK